MKLMLRAKMLGKKITLMSTAFVLAVSTLAAAVPFIAAEQVSAVGKTPVTQGSSAGWTTYTNAGLTAVHVSDSTAPGGNGAARLSTSTSSQYIQVDRELSSTANPVKASELNLSYATKRLAGPVHAAPSYVVAIDKDGDRSSTGDVFWAWYEPVYNNTAGNDYSQWNTWTITPESRFWYNGAKPAEAVSYMQTLSSVLSNTPNAVVVGFTINMGSGNAGWSALVDDVRTTEATYDFQAFAPTLAVNFPRENAVVGTVTKSDVIEIKGSFKDDVKANYATLQLVRNGSSVAIGTVYGYGSTFNPAATYANADGSYAYNMTVPANLPSGEYSLFYTGTDFTGGATQRMERKFFIDNTNPTTTLEVEGLVNNTVGNTFTISGDAADNKDLSRVYVQMVDRQRNVRVGGTTIHLDGASAHWSKTFNANDLGIADGQYAAHVSVTDTAGNTSSVGWTNNFTVDKTAPTAPVLSAKGIGGVLLVSGGFTSSYNVTAEWNANPDVASYTYTYWNDITGSQWNETNKYSVANLSGLSRSGVFNQGNGTHYIQIIARDMVGNTSASNVFSVTYDNVAPEISGLTLNKTLTNESTVSVSGTVSDANLQKYTYQIVDSAKKNVLGEYSWSKTGGTSSINGGELFTASLSGLRLDGVNVADLPDGNYFVRVWAEDKAGNKTGITSQFYLPFTIDRTAPVATVDTLAFLTGDAQIIGGTAGSGATSVDLSVGDVLVASNIIPDANGNWSHTLSPAMAAGIYDLSVVARDEAGNQSAPTATAGFGVLTISVPQAQQNEDTTDTDEGEEVATTTGATNSTAQLPFAFAQSGVLGDADTTIPESDDNNSAAEIKGASDILAQAVDADNTNGEALGLAWYWWLVIVAGAAALVWWIVAMIRGRNAQA